MPTNEDRKEVVKALRDLCDGCETVSDYDLAKALCLVAVSRNAYSSDSVLRIADLIEPEPERTCKWSRGCGYDTGCGNNYLDPLLPKFCPYCGGKVEAME